MTEFEILLNSAVELSISPAEAIERLTVFATHSFDTNPAYVTYRKSISDEVELRAEHVAHALSEYLCDRLSAKGLRDWALFIALSGHYRNPTPPEEDEDWFDLMWDVVHELAAPEVHGAITPELVRKKLRGLERYR